MISENDLLLTAAEVAKILRISLIAFHVRRSRGADLPAPLRLGRLLRWRREAVTAWLTEKQEARTPRGERKAKDGGLEG